MCVRYTVKFALMWKDIVFSALMDDVTVANVSISGSTFLQMILNFSDYTLLLLRFWMWPNAMSMVWIPPATLNKQGPVVGPTSHFKTLLMHFPHWHLLLSSRLRNSWHLAKKTNVAPNHQILIDFLLRYHVSQKRSSSRTFWWKHNSLYNQCDIHRL